MSSSQKSAHSSNQSGILAFQQIKALNQEGMIISNAPFDQDQIQPASLDLRLGERAYRIRSSFLPGPDKTVESRLQALKLHEIDLTKGAVLETGCVYLVPLQESLHLSANISATANPKSSTGRLDIFTRLITDYSRSFDRIGAGYKGKLYAEISPRTFPALVRMGSRLSQIRFRKGLSLISDEALIKLQQQYQLVESKNAVIDNGLHVSIDLNQTDANGFIGYRAKRHTALVDVDKKNACTLEEYWEPLKKTNRGLILDPEEFYILVSRESVHIPPDYAAEMVPFDPLVGEFRAHYAGFFDPGFGHSPSGGRGSKAVLEVRSRDVPFILEHGQNVARLVYEPMIEQPEVMYGNDLGSNYQAQGLKLSKHFRI